MNIILETVIQATNTFTDTGTAHFTIADSGSDDYLVDAGTASFTIATSGTDGGQGAVDAGSAAFTFAVSAVDPFTAADASTTTFLRDRHHNVVQVG